MPIVPHTYWPPREAARLSLGDHHEHRRFTVVPGPHHEVKALQRHRLPWRRREKVEPRAIRILPVPEALVERDEQLAAVAPAQPQAAIVPQVALVFAEHPGPG